MFNRWILSHYLIRVTRYVRQGEINYRNYKIQCFQLQRASYGCSCSSGWKMEQQGSSSLALNNPGVGWGLQHSDSDLRQEGNVLAKRIRRGDSQGHSLNTRAAITETALHQNNQDQEGTIPNWGCWSNCNTSDLVFVRKPWLSGILPPHPQKSSPAWDCVFTDPPLPQHPAVLGDEGPPSIGWITDEINQTTSLLSVVPFGSSPSLVNKGTQGQEESAATTVTVSRRSFGILFSLVLESRVCNGDILVFGTTGGCFFGSESDPIGHLRARSQWDHSECGSNVQALSVWARLSKFPVSACPGVVEEESFPFWTEGDRGECPSWLMVAFGAVRQNIG